MNTELKKVMVVGGGIAGLTAAWELSRLGIGVELVEKSHFLGGQAIQFCCKATDECQQCGACEVEKMLKRVVEEPAIRVHLAAEVEKSSRNGRFTVSLQKRPQYIIAGKEREFTHCYEKIAPKENIQRGFSKNNSPLYAIEIDKVPAVKEFCLANCARGVVDFDQEPTFEDLRVDAIIVANGFSPYDATQKATYGYGKWANVVTGLDFERGRRLNGAYLRPSDGQRPRKIAFIQCVGSRDEHIGNLWCSTVCCPYALRMSAVLKHEDPQTDVTIFYMDIQNTGRNFPTFYQQCQTDLKFVRNIPVDVYPLENDCLRIRHMGEEDGTPVDAEFDLLVLSIGLTPGADNPRLAEMFGLALDEDGFILAADGLNRAHTSADGIFVAGTAQGPKTIAVSMAHAGQAAGEAIKYLKGAK